MRTDRILDFGVQWCNGLLIIMLFHTTPLLLERENVIRFQNGILLRSWVPPRHRRRIHDLYGCSSIHAALSFRTDFGFHTLATSTEHTSHTGNTPSEGYSFLCRTLVSVRLMQKENQSIEINSEKDSLFGNYVRAFGGQCMVNRSKDSKVGIALVTVLGVGVC